MSPFLDGLMSLWTEPVEARPDPVASFRAVYADPVVVNGAPTSVPALVERATALHRAFAGLRAEVRHAIEADGRIVVGFVLHGRHVGPLVTPFGVVAATGRAVAIPTTDILTVTDGLITGVWVVSDELGMLRQLDVLALAQPTVVG